jgi:hypothetical protein
MKAGDRVRVKANGYIGVVQAVSNGATPYPILVEFSDARHGDWRVSLASRNIELVEHQQPQAMFAEPAA